MEWKFWNWNVHEKVSSNAKRTWKLHSMKMRIGPHYDWGYRRVCSAEIIRELREDLAKADKNLFKWLFALLTPFIVFCFQYAIFHLGQLLTLFIIFAFYMPNYPVIFRLSERERGSKHANSVYLAKIENSSNHQNLNHIQCWAIWWIELFN